MMSGMEFSRRIPLIGSTIALILALVVQIIGHHAWLTVAIIAAILVFGALGLAVRIRQR
jgi:predicted PurR-regulated permease PerM